VNGMGVASYCYCSQFVVASSAGWIFDQTNHQIIGQNMKKGQ